MISIMIVVSSAMAVGAAVIAACAWVSRRANARATASENDDDVAARARCSGL